MRTFTALVVLGLLTACQGGPGTSTGKPQRAGYLLDPYCAPDGSVVQAIYPNEQGRYDTALSKPENCPWNKKAAQ